MSIRTSGTLAIPLCDGDETRRISETTSPWGMNYHYLAVILLVLSLILKGSIILRMGVHFILAPKLIKKSPTYELIAFQHFLMCCAVSPFSVRQVRRNHRSPDLNAKTTKCRATPLTFSLRMRR